MAMNQQFILSIFLFKWECNHQLGTRIFIYKGIISVVLRMEFVRGRLSLEEKNDES
jgi:hypothetical protein